MSGGCTVASGLNFDQLGLSVSIAHQGEEEFGPVKDISPLKDMVVTDLQIIRHSFIFFSLKESRIFNTSFWVIFFARMVPLTFMHMMLMLIACASSFLPNRVLTNLFHLR